MGGCLCSTEDVAGREWDRVWKSLGGVTGIGSRIGEVTLDDRCLTRP